MSLAQQAVVLRDELFVVSHGVAKEADDGGEKSDNGNGNENGLNNCIELQVGSLSLRSSNEAHKEQAGVQ